MFKKDRTAGILIGLLASFTKAKDEAVSAIDLFKMVRTAKQMATAPRLYSSAEDDQPGKFLSYCSLTAMCRAGIFETNLIYAIYEWDRDAKV